MRLEPSGQLFRGAMAAAVVAGLTFMTACGSSSTPVSQASPSLPAASPSPSPLACTSAGSASSSWVAASSRTSTSPAIVSATVNGDTLVLTFDQGTPTFAVTPQASAHFTATTGQGAPVDLKGSAGVLIVLRGFRGDIQNYAGTKDFTATGQTLMEVRAIGEFEGVVGWAAGLSKAGCANVAAGTNTLTITFVPSAA